MFEYIQKVLDGHNSYFIITFAIIFGLFLSGIAIVMLINKKANAIAIGEKNFVNSLPFGGVVAEFLMKSRYVKPGILQKIFLSVLGASAVKGEKDRYNCPWYLCISTPNADSNQIIGELKDYDDSLKDITFDEINNLTCHVLHDAVLFNLTKDMIQERFATILDLMRVYKPMRPVEGAIIFANPIDMIDTKGLGHLYNKKMQEIFSLMDMNVPVYVVLTNCENIKGFEGMKEVFETGQEIFGYSALSQDKLECDFQLLEDMEHGICDDIAKRTILESISTTKSIKKSIIFKKNFNDFFKHISAFMKLFLNSEYEPINFKGLYITGISQDKSMDKNGDTKTNSVQVNFIKDLFFKKIFKEHVQARPMHNLLSSYHRFTNKIHKISIGVLAIFTAVAIFRLYDFYYESKRILPLFNIVEQNFVDLEKIENMEDEEQIRLQLNRRYDDILPAISQIDLKKLESWFLPISHITTFHDKILNALFLSYDYIILRAQYFNNLYNGYLLSREQNPNYSIEQQNDIKDNEFYNHFINYLADVIKFEKDVQSYNNLEIGDTKDKQHLKHMTKVLENKYNMKSKIYSNPRFHKIFTDKYAPMIEDNIRLLLNRFLNSIFISPYTKDLYEITLQINNFQSNIYDTNPTVNMYDLKNIHEDVSKMINLFSGIGFDWWNIENIEDNKYFKDIFTKLESSKIVSIQFNQDMARVMKKTFNAYKEDLKNYKTNITGTIFDTESYGLSGVSSVSAVLVRLNDDLTNFFNEKFMIDIDANNFNFDEIIGKNFLWDNDILESHKAIKASYEKFQSDYLSKYSKQFKDFFAQAAKIHLQDLFLKTLSRAQKYKDDSEYSSTEIKMVSIAQNVKQSSKSLPVIIGFLNKNNENYNRMKGFIANNSIKLLEYADSKMDKEGIFKIENNIAKNWKGEKNANMKIFGKQNPQAVKAHFDSQYQRVLALSDNIAKPANLIFQNTEFLSYKNNPSISDWIMIENQIKEFQNKAANNQIEAIEKYMTSELSDIDYKKCFKKKTKSVDSDNFFAKTLNDMQTAVIKRCNEINYEKAIENYNEIATFFNTNMAGRFPFSMQNTRQDIDLSAINKFIKLYEEKQDKIRETLEELTKDSKILFEDAKQFLIQTADVYEFLKEGLKKDGSLGYKIKSEYNAHSNKAEGNESLIDFTVTSGPLSVPQSAEKKEFEWRYGDNFSIGVDYIRDGPWIPIESDNYPNVAAISNKANIRTPGPWSFIRMANAFRATTQDLGGIENPNGDILKFDIQSASSREVGQFLKTKFFMKFSIMKKGKDGKEQEMKIPQFPQSAPILSDVLYSMIDRAVESNM